MNEHEAMIYLLADDYSSLEEIDRQLAGSPVEPVQTSEAPSVALVAPSTPLGSGQTRGAEPAPAQFTWRPTVFVTEPPVPQWPAPPSDDALYGLAGEVVRIFEPHTESDSMAILLQFLVACGNAIGRSPRFRVEGNFHHTNLFLVLVGASAKARKGTSWGQVLRLMKMSAEPVAVESIWYENSLISGLSSGEGLISAVSDTSESDSFPSATDKRRLIVESEFARPLVSMSRDGNVLSEVLRGAWDSGDMSILTRECPLRATDAHISIIGHITSADLRRHLRATDQTNGFGNRFLWICVKRSRLLPDGGALNDEVLSPLADRLREVIAFGASVQEMRRSEEARDLWREQYESLSRGRPGLLGSLTSRAEAQVLRLSMIYALLDRSALVRVEHLRAALEVWRYCERSVLYIFGDATGDALADALLELLRDAGARGQTRTEIRDHFNRHKKAGNVAQALATLQEVGLVRMEQIPTGGRSGERWFAI